MPRKKIVDIIISLVCALALWAYVTTEINPTQTATVKGIAVELMNVDALAADVLTVGAGSYMVDVVVEGKRSVLGTLTAEDFVATADVINYPKGENNVPVNVKAPDGVIVQEVFPDQIQVDIEDLVTANKPVKLSYTQKFPDGMEPGFISLVPKEIAVSGTKADVDNVDYIRAEIDSMKLKSDEVTLRAYALPVDKSGDRVLGLSMSQDTVEVTMRLCHVKEVPFEAEIKGRPPGALAVTKMDVPTTVAIRGSEDDISKIDKVTAAPISISNLRSTTIITPELDLPNGVELADASKDFAVTIEIGGEEAKSFNVTNDMVEIRGVPKGYSAHIVTGALSVTVFGSHEQLRNFSTDDLKLYVDLSTIDPTQGPFKALVEGDDSRAYKRIDVSPVAVDVTVIALPGSDIAVENAPEPATKGAAGHAGSVASPEAKLTN
ncbi:MAG: hypothetical protein LBG50_03110 [Clostridiales Family XIII bacterium]|jgi:YbbR domain-containing protein|nr:hypothetical protein [Clostridiales Family XIII bacterium]